VVNVMEDYARLNQANWESRVAHHVGSAEYGVQAYAADPALLSSVVRFDLPRLGNVAGCDLVHLQCHIGTDTLSLARLGAHPTGLDFSPSALAAARDLAARCGQAIDYVEAEVYDAPRALGEGRFDIVYTGIGALCWLPDIARWAAVVAALLRPGGRLFIREGHPMLWALADERPDGLLAVELPYFEGPGTDFFTAKTYVDHAADLRHPQTHEFNHGLAEIFNALMRAGMRITAFDEHDSVPWPAQGSLMVACADGEYRLRERPRRLPCSYTLQAVKSHPINPGVAPS
jgi:SAM-dependent methyltransferase